MTNRHARPKTVRDLVKSLSGTYRNACPGLTVITVRDLPKPADGVEIRVILDFGAGFIDHRGWFQNPGA